MPRDVICRRARGAMPGSLATAARGADARARPRATPRRDARRATARDARPRRRCATVSASRDDENGTPRRARASWDDRFDEVALFKSMHGADVARLPRELNAQRRWLARQRYLARRGELSETRMERLRALGVTFELRKAITKVPEEIFTFDARLRELARCYASDGAVPRSKALSRWVSHCVADHRDGSLSREKYEALRDLGVDFDGVEERRVVQWETRCEALEAYVKTRGHCRVREDEEDGLYFWLLDQRKAKRDGKLSKERETALEALGVEWDVRSTVHKSWEDRLSAMRSFYETRGALPRSSEDDALFQWIRQQRRRFEKGELELERVEALDGVCVEWKVKRAAGFEKNIARFAEYVETHGSPHVLARRDKKLHQWIRKMRVKREAGELSARKIEALDALGMHWTVPPIDIDRTDRAKGQGLFGSFESKEEN
jgi:hypothetical protein